MSIPTPTPNPFLKGNSGNGGGTGTGSNPFLKQKPVATKRPAAKAADAGTSLSFGQQLLNIISTPLYYITGSVNKNAENFKNGNILGAIANSSTIGQIAGLFTGGPSSAGVQNVANAFQGKKTITGGDVLETAGWKNPGFVPSLAADILFDPLTYTPGAAVSIPIKTLAKAGTTAARAVNLTSKGLAVGEAAAARAVANAPKVELNTVKSFIKSGFTETSANAGGKELAKRMPGMQKEVIPAYKVGARSTTQALVDLANAAAVGAWRGAKLGAKQGSTTEVLRKIAKDIRKAEKKTPTQDLLKELPKSNALNSFTPSAGVADVLMETGAKAAAPVVETAAKVSQEVAKEVAPTVDNTAAAVLDRPFSPAEMEVLVNKNRANIKDAQVRLKAADKVAQGAEVGIRDTTSISKSVMALVGEANKATKIFSPTVVSRVVSAENPADLQAILKAMSESPDSAVRAAYGAIAARTWKTAAGAQSTVADALKGGLRSLSKADYAAAKKEIDILLNTYGKPANLTKQMFSRVSALIGEQLASELKATGALAGKADEKTLSAAGEVLKKIQGGAAKKYANAEEMIVGMTNGDNVAPQAVVDLLKALDPEHKLIAEAEKAALSDDSIKAIVNLLGKEGRKTIAAVSRRIEEQTSQNLLSSKKVAFGDAISYAIDRAAMGEDIAGDLAVLAEREYRAKALTESTAWMTTSDAEIRKLVDGVLDSAARGIGTQYRNIIEVIDAGAEDGLNMFGNVAVKLVDDEGKVTKAFLPGVFSQHIYTKIWGSLVQKGTFAVKNAAKKAKKTGEPAKTLDRMADIADKYQILRDVVLGQFGVRPVYVRSVERAGAKLENEYYAYIDMGDFAKLVAESGKHKGAIAARNAFFAVDMKMKGVTDRAADSFSPQSIETAIVNHIESLDTKKIYTREKMIEDLQFRPNKNWSPAFAAKAEQMASDMADLIIENGERFANIHKARLIAEIGDSSRAALIMSADIFNPILEAARISLSKGVMTDAERVKAAATAWNKFSIATDAFMHENGPAAAATLRANAMMFIRLSGVEDIVRIAGKAGNDAPVEARYLKAATLVRKNNELSREFRDLVIGMNTARLARNKTAEIMADTPPIEVQRIALKLEEKKSAFEALAIKGAAGFDSPEALTAWKKQMDAAKRQYDNIRKRAIAARMDTEHWSAMKAATSEDGLGWVSSKAFNHAKESAFVKNLGKPALLDEATKAARAKATKAQKAAQKKRANKVNLESVEQQIQQGVDDLADALPQVQKLLPGDEFAQASRLIQEDAMSVPKAAEIQVEIADNILLHPITYAEAKSFYKRSRVPATAGNYSRESLTFIQRMGDKLSIFGEKGLTMGMYRSHEGATFKAIADVTDTLRRAWHGFNKAGLTEKDFGQAYSAARKLIRDDNAADFVFPDGAMGDAIKALYGTMQAVTSRMKAFNIDAEMLQRMLNKQGISERNGFQRIDELEDTADLWDLFDHMPFMEKPEFDLTTEAGRRASENWDVRGGDYAKRYASGDADGAFTALSKVMAAIQFTVMHQELALDAIARFNYKAEDLAIETARARGYVTIKGVGNGYSVTDLMPTTAAEGNLFHPDVARSLSFLDREFNRTFNGTNLPKWIQGTIEITQVLKSTQTILRPGHLATTIVGDYSLALMVNKFNPRDWAMAFRIAKLHATKNIKADYAALGTMEDSLKRAIASIEGVGGREFVGAENTKFSMLLGTSSKGISDEELVNFFTDNGILTGNMQVNEAAMMDLEIAARAGGRAADTEGNDVIAQTVRNGSARNKAMLLHQRISKVPGDTVAYTSNVPRLVTALRVMREGKFNTLQEAMNAAGDEVRLYHPTMDSLTASERKGPRLFFSYYTWLKTAHLAMFQMVMNHTAAMTLPSKALFNMAKSNDQEGAYSYGNMWGDKTKTPGYLDYSTYGPVMDGPRGPMLWKPSILQLDVLDTWNFANDPTKTVDQNVWSNISSAGRTLGSNMNMVAQPLIQLATQTNMSTGKPEPIKSTQQFADKYVQLLGFTQALKAAGIYTPYNKIDNKTNPLTQRDRDLAGLNFTFGQRFADTQKPSDVKNAKMEETAKKKRIAEQLAQQINQGK